MTEVGVPTIVDVTSTLGATSDVNVGVDGPLLAPVAHPLATAATRVAAAI